MDCVCILGKAGLLCNAEPSCGAGAQVCDTGIGQEGSVLLARGERMGKHWLKTYGAVESGVTPVSSVVSWSRSLLPCHATASLAA